MKFKAFLLATALILSTSCTEKKKGAYGLDRSETLYVNFGSEPPTIDWNKISDSVGGKVVRNIMDGLVDYSFSGPVIQLKPALATEWKASKDAKTWTFKIRKNVYWNDGVLFTPQHVVDSWQRLLSPDTAAKYAYFLYDIKNAKKYSEGKIKDFSKVGVRATKNHQVVVELERPKSFFPMLLTHYPTYPIRLDVVNKHGNRWTEPENIVSLGSFNLKIWKHDHALVLERNDNYYGEKAKIKNVLGYTIAEQSTALTLYDSRKVDALQDLPARELANLRKRKGYSESPVLGIYYYGFNINKPPVNNKLVRKALAHAFDKTQITRFINGGEYPLFGLVPKGLSAYDESVGLKFDIKKANEYLDKAGYKDRSKFPKIVLAYNTNENHKQVAENFQAQIKKNLGIQVEVQNAEWKVYLDKLRYDPPHVYRMAWIGDYPDPDTFLNTFTSYSANNYAKWKNKTYDKYIEEAAASLNKKKRIELYTKAQQLIVQKDTAIMPIYGYSRQYLIRSRVKNYPQNPMLIYKYKGVSLSE